MIRCSVLEVALPRVLLISFLLPYLCCVVALTHEFHSCSSRACWSAPQTLTARRQLSSPEGRAPPPFALWDSRLQRLRVLLPLQGQHRPRPCETKNSTDAAAKTKAGPTVATTHSFVTAARRNGRDAKLILLLVVFLRCWSALRSDAQSDALAMKRFDFNSLIGTDSWPGTQNPVKRRVGSGPRTKTIKALEKRRGTPKNDDIQVLTVAHMGSSLASLDAVDVEPSPSSGC